AEAVAAVRCEGLALVQAHRILVVEHRVAVEPARVVGGNEALLLRVAPTEGAVHLRSRLHVVVEVTLVVGVRIALVVPVAELLVALPRIPEAVEVAPLAGIARQIGPERVFGVVAGTEAVRIGRVDEAVAVVVLRVAAGVELVAAAEGGAAAAPDAHAHGSAGRGGAARRAAACGAAA